MDEEEGGRIQPAVPLWSIEDLREAGDRPNLDVYWAKTTGGFDSCDGGLRGKAGTSEVR
jgi:hypothetical protein